MLSIQIQKKLGDLDLNVDLQLPMTGITAIFGRSGAGKTSLIQAISGLSVPDVGCIRLGQHRLFDSNCGLSLPVNKRRIGYVFQDARLFPHYTVAGNLMYGIRQKDPVYFDQIVTLLGIQPLLTRYPAGLSGGEKQRVAIGRALLSRPDLLLMDEPLAALDLPRKKELIGYLEQLAQKVNLPILYVTHSLDEIARLADHIVVLHQGLVVASGRFDDVWGSDSMDPWFLHQAKSGFLKGQVVAMHNQYPLAKVQFDSSLFAWLPKEIGQLNKAVRVRILADDILIATEPPNQTSIEHIFPMVIAAMTTCDERVSIQLKHNTINLWANLPFWSVEELNLVVGQSVFALLKRIEIMR